MRLSRKCNTQVKNDGDSAWTESGVKKRYSIIGNTCLIGNAYLKKERTVNETDFTKSLRVKQREVWLKLANDRLRGSDDDFLKGFCRYLREGYKDSKQADAFFKKPVWATEQQNLLKEMLDSADFSLIQSTRVKGYALIGKTSFNKLEFIKNYFAACGLTEFAGGEANERYAVVDCSRVKGYISLLKALVKYQDAAYMVFNNCESILKHDGALQAFKQLSEVPSGITIAGKNDETVNFTTDSFLVFLGKENTLHAAVEKQIPKGLGDSAYSHLAAFIRCIHVYDFEKGERYYGHDITFK
jgi:hypothetical protein